MTSKDKQARKLNDHKAGLVQAAFEAKEAVGRLEYAKERARSEGTASSLAAVLDRTRLAHDALERLAGHAAAAVEALAEALTTRAQTRAKRKPTTRRPRKTSDKGDQNSR